MEKGKVHGDAGGLLGGRREFEEWANQVVRAVDERRTPEEATATLRDRPDLGRPWSRTKIRLLKAFLSN